MRKLLTYMHFRILGVCALLTTCYNGFAQDLSKSRQNSYYTYIFRVQPEQAKEIFQFKKNIRDSSLLKIPVDSFPADSQQYRKTLPPGFYLYVKAEKDNLQYNLVPVNGLEAVTYTNYRDLIIKVFRKKDGQPVEDALVELDGKKIPFDTQTRTYRLPKSNRKGLLSVSIKDEVALYSIERERYNPRAWRVIRTISYSFPVAYILYPFRRVISKISNDGFLYGLITTFKRDRYRKTHKGYIAFNKPKYLPGDTVKMKAFIVKKNGKPYTKTVQVTLQKRWYGRITELGEIKPIAKGAYEFCFPANDSLELNSWYNIELKDKKKKRELLSSEFYYEDYQLNETSYEARSDKRSYSRGEPVLLYVSGKDANGLPLLDGRVELEATVENVNTFFNKSVFVPNRLWEYKGRLDPAGETKFTIPDSIFPAADLKVKIKAVFNNSNNERRDTSFTIEYKGKEENISVKLEGKYILADYKGENRQSSGEGILFGTGPGKNDTLVKMKIRFPFKEVINPFVYKYVFTEPVTGEVKTFEMYSQSSRIETRQYRTHDSVFIFLENPRELDVHYFIYNRQNKILEKGTAKTLNWKRSDPDGDSYFVSWHYRWAGYGIDLNEDIHLFDKALNVTLEQPEKVYPGQKATIGVRVKDFKNNPVPGVNITAGSVNGQFTEKYYPDIPYLGKHKKGRKNINEFTIEEQRYVRNSFIGENWRKRMKLDTIAYYRMLFPPGGLHLNYCYTGADNAQFSAFLVKNGSMENVYMLYLDEKLAYYYDTERARNYAITAKEGYHRLRIRGKEGEYILDSVLLKKDYKLDLSLDISKLPAHARIVKNDLELSPREKYLLQNNILLLRNNFYREGPVWIWQGDNIISVPENYYNYQLKVGPFLHDTVYVGVQDKFKTAFVFEPGYWYTIQKGLIKQTGTDELSNLKKFPEYIYNKPGIGEIALSASAIRLNSEPSKANRYITPFNPSSTTSGRGTYRFEYTGDSSLFLLRITRMDSSLKSRMYTGSVRNIYDLDPGYYQLVLITSSENYLVKDSIRIQGDGILFERIGDKDLSVSDTLSGKLGNSSKVPSILLGRLPADVKNTGAISGTVTDERTGVAIPFANVSLARGNDKYMATTSDINGKFSMNLIPAGEYKIRVTYIGFSPLEILNIQIVPGKEQLVEAKLRPSENKLREVLLIANRERQLLDVNVASAAYMKVRGNRLYDASESHQSVQFLGSVASKSGYFSYAKAKKKRFRAASPSFLADQTELGYEPRLGGFEEEGIDGLELGVMGGIPASYGEAGDDLLKSAKQLRDKFSDYAYWQPNLYTNDSGQVFFEATFPDNITKWKSFALAMDGKRHSGTGFSETQSYKNLMATLATPRFLIEGDKTFVTGKTLNYTQDSFPVKTSFYTDGKIFSAHDTGITEALIERFPVLASTADSVTLKYIVSLKDGYSDGEERKIPVFPKGDEETVGYFYVLNGDTPILIPEEYLKGDVQVYVQDNALGMMLNEIGELKKYPYFCMEQMASKLKGYLMEETIKESLKEKSTAKREIKDLIKKLEKGQQENGSWGWWGRSRENTWMTIYVTDVLVKAQLQGFDSKKSIDKAFRYLSNRIDVLRGENLLNLLNLYSALKVQISYASYLRKVEQDSLNLYRKLLICKIRQENKIPFDTAILASMMKKSLFGNYYWGNESEHWYDNSNNCTMLAYRILENMDITHSLLPGIRNYFLEAKGRQQWRNTIEVASIIETILPGMLREHGPVIKKSTLEFSGAVSKQVMQFPYHTKLPGNTGPLRVTKRGAGPVYLSVYRKSWNVNPVENDSIYSIRTYFETKGKRSNALTAGEETSIVVEINVKRKSSYVMVNVPIPAGCSYDPNTHSENRHESHREYFKHKTSIFFEELPQGVHMFRIGLQSRFSGEYTVNPSRAEQMYFPVFFGRNALQFIGIKQP